MAEWNKEDEELFKKYAMDIQKKILSGGYTDPEEIKKESDRIVKHHNIEDAHAILGNTFGRGGGTRWAKAKGIEGLIDTVELVSMMAGAGKGTGKDYAKRHLPQNNAKMFKEAGENLLVGEDVEKKVAGGEGQNYRTTTTTTKAALKTNDLSAKEFKKLRDEFRKNSSYGSSGGFGDFSLDPNDLETKKLIEKFKKERPTTSEEDANYNPYMKLTRDERRAAASREGYDYVGDHERAGKKMREELEKKPTEIIPKWKDPKMTEPNTVINKGVPKSIISDNLRNRNKNDATAANYANRMLDKLVYFMDSYGDTPIGKALRKTALSTFDWKLSEPGTTGNLPQQYKDTINRGTGSAERPVKTKGLRNAVTKSGKDYFETALKPAMEKLRNQFDSIYSEKDAIKYAERIAGRKFPDKRAAVAFLAAAVANALYSEDLSEDLSEKQHKSKLYEDEGLIPSEGTYGARYNAERLAGNDRAKMLKAGDLLINDWLGKFSEKNIDEDDIEVLEEIRDIMNSYNKSKGQPIRASDSIIADILSNPVYMKMFNKYNDPMLHMK